MADIVSLALFRIAHFVGGADQTTEAVDVRGYDVVGVQKDNTITGTSLTFTGNFDGLDELVPIVDSANTAVTLTVSAATAQLSLFQQVKEIRALNQLAVTTNGAAPGAGKSVIVGLRWIT
jgi:hypothetical protein